MKYFVLFLFLVFFFIVYSSCVAAGKASLMEEKENNFKL